MRKFLTISNKVNYKGYRAINTKGKGVMLAVYSRRRQIYKNTELVER